jgi:phage gp36-like protein
MAYATPADLAQLGLAAGALAGVSLDAQTAALQSASDEADGYLSARYTLPLLVWGGDLKLRVCELAAWTVLKTRGFDPASGDAALRDASTDARKWLADVSARRVNPRVTDSSPTQTPAAPQVVSNPRRGWDF